MPRIARLSQTITLHLQVLGAEDEHGNPTTTDSDTDVPGFITAQFPQENSSGEIVGGGFRLYLDSGASLSGWDACSVDSLRYEIIGTPWAVFNPRTAKVHHIEANIRRAGVS